MARKIAFQIKSLSLALLLVSGSLSSARAISANEARALPRCDPNESTKSKVQNGTWGLFGADWAVKAKELVLFEFNGLVLSIPAWNLEESASRGMIGCLNDKLESLPILFRFSHDPDPKFRIDQKTYGVRILSLQPVPMESKSQPNEPDRAYGDFIASQKAKGRGVYETNNSESLEVNLDVSDRFSRYKNLVDSQYEFFLTCVPPGRGSPFSQCEGPFLLKARSLSGTIKVPRHQLLHAEKIMSIVDSSLAEWVVH